MRASQIEKNMKITLGRHRGTGPNWNKRQAKFSAKATLTNPIAKDSWTASFWSILVDLSVQCCRLTHTRICWLLFTFPTRLFKSMWAQSTNAHAYFTTIGPKCVCEERGKADSRNVERQVDNNDKTYSPMSTNEAVGFN